jgi:hypothetical protein
LATDAELYAGDRMLRGGGGRLDVSEVKRGPSDDSSVAGKNGLEGGAACNIDEGLDSNSNGRCREKN